MFAEKQNLADYPGGYQQVQKSGTGQMKEWKPSESTRIQRALLKSYLQKTRPSIVDNIYEEQEEENRSTHLESMLTIPIIVDDINEEEEDEIRTT